jgi:lipoprotein NlpI
MTPAFRFFFLMAILPCAGQTTNQPASTSTATPQEWVQYGISNGVKGDLDTAISNFNEAIKIDPKYAPAYESRAYAEALQHKLDVAIVDYSQAIAIDPKYADALYNRGVAKGESGDLDGALADFNATIEANPKYVTAYYNRGHVKYFKGDLDGTISDLNQAIALDANSPYAFYIRGLARLAENDKEGAGSDFEQSAVNGFPDAAFWLWIVKTKSGDAGIARSDLETSLSKPQLFKPDGWPLQIGNFLLEKMTQDDLLAKAKTGGNDPDRLCDAWFYSGIVKRFSGDLPGATECFKQAVATGSKVSEIYVEAQRQLASLQKSQ